jgi:bacterioferritin-associated ferredoxin
MYLCVCLAVTVSEVENVIEQGADTREAVTRACRAGGDCGACHGSIEAMLEDHLDTTAALACPPAQDSSEQLVPEHQLVRRQVA